MKRHAVFLLAFVNFGIAAVIIGYCYYWAEHTQMKEIFTGLYTLGMFIGLVPLVWGIVLLHRGCSKPPDPED